MLDPTDLCRSAKQQLQRLRLIHIHLCVFCITAWEQSVSEVVHNSGCGKTPWLHTALRRDMSLLTAVKQQR